SSFGVHPCRSSIKIPPPLVGGGLRGRGLRAAARKQSQRRDRRRGRRFRVIRAYRRETPPPFPPPTRGGRMSPLHSPVLTPRASAPTVTIYLAMRGSR